MEEEAALNTEATMEIDVEGGEDGKGEETLMELGATVLLTQESEPVSKMLIDARNDFNDLRDL